MKNADLESADRFAALRVAHFVAALYLRPVEGIFRGTRGQEDEARARQEVAYLLHTACGISLNRVGKALGRDRTTVSYAVRQIEDARTDPRFPGYDARLERLSELVADFVALGAAEDEATQKLVARERAA